MNLKLLNPFSYLFLHLLQKALARHEKNPGLNETLQLVKLFLRCGQFTQAFQYSDAGQQKFPTSLELKALRKTAFKKMAALECKNLTRQIASKPRPEIIAKAIEIWRSSENFKECERLIQKWKDQFSTSWILQFAIGKYLFQKSLETKDRKIKVNCLEQLKKVAELNPENYKTLLYLAALHSEVGSVSEALVTLDRILTIYPKDVKSTGLKEKIRRSQKGRQLAHDALLKTAAKITEEGKPLKEASDDLFEDLRESPSIFAALIEEGGRDNPQVRSYFSDTSAFDFEQGEKAFHELMQALRLSSKRMGIGELKICILEGGSWRIFLGNHPAKSLLICTDKNFQEVGFESAIRKIVQEKTVA